MSAPQMLVLMIVALQMQGLFTKQFLVEVETKDDIPNDGRETFQNKALSTDDGAEPKVDFHTMYRFERKEDHIKRIHDSKEENEKECRRESCYMSEYSIEYSKEYSKEYIHKEGCCEWAKNGTDNNFEDNRGEISCSTKCPDGTICLLTRESTIASEGTGFCKKICSNKNDCGPDQLCELTKYLNGIDIDEISEECFYKDVCDGVCLKNQCSSSRKCPDSPEEVLDFKGGKGTCIEGSCYYPRNATKCPDCIWGDSRHYCLKKDGNDGMCRQHPRRWVG